MFGDILECMSILFCLKSNESCMKLLLNNLNKLPVLKLPMDLYFSVQCSHDT